MKYTARQYTTRAVARLRQAGARVDRRKRWTLVPILVIVILWVPIWSGAIRFTSLGPTRADSVRVPILVYHSIAPLHAGQSSEQRLLDVDTAMFRWQMNYLAANKFTVVSLEALVDALQGKGTIPSRAVVLTFDDGWATQYENAFPILKQMHYPATFFVVTGQVGRAAYMGLDDLKRLQAAGMTIAAHTRTHPQLTKLSDAQMRDEIIGSRKDLQLMLGITTDLFAYPYGAHNTKTMAVVQEAGFRAAREMGGGAWNDATDRLALHSVLATNDMSTFARDLGVPLMAARPSRRFEVAVRHGIVAR